MADLKVGNDFFLALLATAEDGGASEADLIMMTEPDVFAQLLLVIRRQAEVVIKEGVTKIHIIDCDADPYLPEGWSVEEHTKGGQLEWNPEKVELWVSKHQKSSPVIGGNELRKKLASRPTLNANVLDYLIRNPDLIPNEWKGTYVNFWGTIYRAQDHVLVVRCLYWYSNKWQDSYIQLSVKFVNSRLAALRK